jgi:tripeptidyl-peptidase-1
MRYHRLSVLSVLAAALLASPATPLPSPWGKMLVKHKWTRIPDSWLTLGHPPNSTSINLHIALKPERENALINALHDVSQPGDPKYVLFTTLFEAYLCVPPLYFRYGAHLTKEQVSQLVAPHPDTLELVSSWLKYNGVPPSSISITHGGCWLTVTSVPVSQANKLLGASYQLYHHPGTDETILRTVGYALPAALHIHVRTIAPTTAFTSTRLRKPEDSETPRSRSSGAVNTTSGEPVNMLLRREPDEPMVDPSVLRGLYGTVTYFPVAVDRNQLGIVGYENQYPSHVDLSAFMTRFRSDAAAVRMTAIEVINYQYRGKYGMQANLDVQSPRPWRTRPRSSTTGALALACGQSRPSTATGTYQAPATSTLHGSATCCRSRKSRRRSPWGSVPQSPVFRWTMQWLCVSCSHSSVRAELASSSRAAIPESA